MADQLEVTPATLRAAAGTWHGEAPVVETALRRLEGRLQALGEPWGNDDPGRAFASQYRPNARKLVSAVDQLARGLDAIADGLDAMADRYERAEDASAVEGRGR